MTLTARTTTGVQRFRCIGSACEYTCCSGWQVPVDQPHFEALETALGSPSGSTEALDRLVERVPPRDPRGFAAMRILPASGDCAALTPDRLCSLQARFGEEILPNGCARYPRSLATVGGQSEIWGLLSCPEIARQCLLPEDGMQLVDGPPFGRPLEGRVLPEPQLPYALPLDELRGAIYALLSHRQFSLDQRLFFVVYLGQRVSPFFHRAAASLPRERLAAELARLRDGALLASLAANFQALPRLPTLQAAVVASILRLGADRHLAPLIAKVLASYGAEGAVQDGARGGLSVEPEPLWRAYSDRRLFWDGRHADRLAMYGENHAKTHWLKEWYVGSPTLLAHAQLHLCQLAVVRFLLISHPDLQAARELYAEPQRAALDRVAVEVISRVTRALEHNPQVIQKLRDGLAEAGLLDFAHTTALISA